MQYKTCRDCGAHLDFGESCEDCKEKDASQVPARETSRPKRALRKTQEKSTTSADNLQEFFASVQYRTAQLPCEHMYAWCPPYLILRNDGSPEQWKDALEHFVAMIRRKADEL